MRKIIKVFISILILLSLCVSIFTTGCSFNKTSSSSSSDTETLESFTVKFNGNSSISGSMKDEIFVYGEPQKLSKNTFSKDGYDFVGWALSPTGLVQYSDEQEVSDLTTKGSVITLYAVWSNPKLKIYTVTFNITNRPYGYFLVNNTKVYTYSIYVTYNDEFNFSSDFIPIYASEKKNDGKYITTYEFRGWYDDNGTDWSGSGIYLETNDLVLYADIRVSTVPVSVSF